MKYAKRFVDNILGSPKTNMTNKQFRKADFDGDGVPNWKDCRPLDRNRHMVRYVYFEATREGGTKDLLYFGSKTAVQRYGAERGINYISIRELPYAEAKTAISAQRLEDARRLSKKRYTSTGKVI